MFGGSGRPRQRSCRKLGLASLPMSLGANGIGLIAVGALLVVAAAVYLAFLATRRLIRPTARTQEAEQRRFTRNAIAPMVTGFVDRALFWAFWIVVLRRIGPGGNGDYAFAANLLAYFAVVVDFGLGTLVTRDVARDAAGLQRIFGTALALRMRLLAVSMPVMVGIALIYWATGTIDGRALLTTGVLALGLPLAAVNQAYAAVYGAWERIDRRALVVAGTSALTVGLGLVLLAAGLGVVGIALAGLISSGVTLIALGRPVGFGLLRQSVGTQRDDLRQLVRHALPLMLNSLLATAFIQIDILILQALQGTAVVGHYNAAYKFLNAMNVLPAAVVLAAFPLMARAAGDADELARWFTRTWRVLVTAAAGARRAVLHLRRALDRHPAWTGVPAGDGHGLGDPDLVPPAELSQRNPAIRGDRFGPAGEAHAGVSDSNARKCGAKSGPGADLGVRRRPRRPRSGARWCCSRDLAGYCARTGCCVAYWSLPHGQSWPRGGGRGGATAARPRMDRRSLGRDGHLRRSADRHRRAPAIGDTRRGALAVARCIHK